LYPEPLTAFYSTNFKSELAVQESFILVVFVLPDGFSFLFLDEKKRNKEKSCQNKPLRFSMETG